MNPTEKRPPRLAATLILLSTHPDTGVVMIALLRRAQTARFLPGALVFPGGALEVDDHLLIEGAMRNDRVQRALSDHRAWGFDNERAAATSLAAALRETEEEAGLSLSALLSGSNALCCVGHWLTPEALRTRFDTYFWAAELSQEMSLASLEVDGEEIECGEWFDPHEVLRAYERAEVDLPAPTFCIISELADLIEQHASARLTSSEEGQGKMWIEEQAKGQTERTSEPTQISRLIQTLNQAAHLRPICPVLDKMSGVRLYLPGDPSYLQKRDDEPRVGSTLFWPRGVHYLERVPAPEGSGAPCQISALWRRVVKRSEES